MSFEFVVTLSPFVISIKQIFKIKLHSVVYTKNGPKKFTKFQLGNLIKGVDMKLFFNRARSVDDDLNYYTIFI